MANSLIFGSTNFGISGPLSILAGGENSQFPLTNIQHSFTTKVFRSTGTTVDILLDTQNSTTKNMFGIVGNAATGSGLGFSTLSIYGSPTTNFSGSDEIVIDFSDTYNFGYKMFASDVSHRYWKLEFASSGSYVEVSNIFLGAQYGFDTNTLSTTSFEFINTSNNKMTVNDYNQKFITTYNKIKSVTGTIEYINRSEFDLLNYMYNTHGTSSPLWMIFDQEDSSAIDGQYIFSGYYYLRNNPGFQAVGGQLWNSSVEFEEVI